MLKIFLKRPGNGSKDRQSGGRGDDTEGSGSGDEPGKNLLQMCQKLYNNYVISSISSP